MESNTITRIHPQSQWSDAVVHQHTAYFVEVPESGADFASQTQALFAQAERTMALCGTDKRHILRAEIFLADMADFAGMNQAWDKWVPEGATPARATVQAKLANPAWKIEIVVTAAVP